VGVGHLEVDFVSHVAAGEEVTLVHAGGDRRVGACQSDDDGGVVDGASTSIGVAGGGASEDFVVVGGASGSTKFDVDGLVGGDWSRGVLSTRCSRRDWNGEVEESSGVGEGSLVEVPVPCASSWSGWCSDGSWVAVSGLGTDLSDVTSDADVRGGAVVSVVHVEVGDQQTSSGGVVDWVEASVGVSRARNE